MYYVHGESGSEGERMRDRERYIEWETFTLISSS